MEVSIRRWTAIQMLCLKLSKSQFNKLNIICLLNSCSLPDWPEKAPCSPCLAPALYKEPDEWKGAVVLHWWIGYVQHWKKAVVWTGRSESSLADFYYSLVPSNTASIIIEGYSKNMSFFRWINISCVENLLLCFNEALIGRVKTSTYLMPLCCLAFLFHFKMHLLC